MPPEPTAADCPPDAVLVDLLDGRLAEQDAARLTRHTAQCSVCSAVLDQLAKGSNVGAGATHAVETGTDGKIARGLLHGSATREAASSIGRTLGRKYALLRLLGKGGMGEVYEAEHTGTGQRVAVKLIHGRLVARGSEAESRFRREARAAGATQSPHIVEILDSGEDAATGDLYLVMEHLHGEDLQHLIDRLGPLPPDVALRVAAQALVGLAKAHEAGIVHRDIKPANLFLARSDAGEITVKLLDFGIAKVTADALQVALTSGLTRTDGMLGSPLYMSPEQMQNSKSVDYRTDLWSLGSTLYCALAGRAPFRHVENVFELLLAVRSEGAPPLRKLAPWVSPEAAEAVHRALVVDPEERYPSAVAMLEAIRALVPGGVTLREEMLAGMSAEARAAGAASLPPYAGERDVVAPGAAAKVSGDEAIEERDGGGARPSSTRARLAALVAVLLGVGAAVSYAKRVVPAPPARALPAPISVALVVATASAAPAPSATAPPIRRVRLLIVPDDASVEVDGERADVRDGGVEIAGPLGSSHRVHVSKGKNDLQAEVVVSEGGAVPPKVELPLPHPAGAAPKPSSTPRARASASASSGDVMRKPE